MRPEKLPRQYARPQQGRTQPQGEHEVGDAPAFGRWKMLGNPRSGGVVPILQEPGNGKSKRTVSRQGIPKNSFQVKFHKYDFLFFYFLLRKGPESTYFTHSKEIRVIRFLIGILLRFFVSLRKNVAVLFLFRLYNLLIGLFG